MEPQQFGLDQKETENINEMVPNFNFSEINVGETRQFEIVDAEPRVIQHTDKVSGEPRSTSVINAKDQQTGLEVALWLSAKSLQREFFKIAKNKETLEDTKIVIGKRNYQHAQHGTVTAYTVQQIS